MTEKDEYDQKLMEMTAEQIKALNHIPLGYIMPASEGYCCWSGNEWINVKMMPVNPQDYK